MKLNIQKLQIAMANACILKSELSEQSGISATTLSNYLSGKNNPSPKTIGRMARALKIPVTDLIDVETVEA